ncbi:undecaprenyl-diphosphate phosphatase [Acetatifactor muris]|uniref:Undecaprenyl-diphosphatase n=1 Tax=Acetatifactor muris TaxID=879566 RepID=A0A2K4ZID3_9FIRM|nr:undecaprenyl-diphosphate phosphatase [Acetatifactor muris]MCI8798583.1 undecaprenyl-diphosphate phosphatase [Lachnospiraceae bacterium]MCR2048407.1 undecaprenyl-diphosphate phosphatase [Acetatifactor muris]SOY30211.1 Undecaprenyl-diphosphatase [Acetatifactor muris]
MIEIIKAIIYGIVEGITEWLPISSTGHLILVESLMPFQSTEAGGTVSEAFFGMFDVVIQLGAILAVVVLFWSQIWPFALTKKEREKQSGTGIMTYFKKDIWVLWFKILVSCVPAAVIGILFDDVFDALFYNPVCVAIALIVFGVAFIIIENWNKGRQPKVRKLSQITYQTALMIGVFQVIAAVFPGTSRSGATIVGALLIGVSRTVAAEYTFFLAIPVMFGASLLKVVKFGFEFTSLELTLLTVGTVVSFIVSLFVLRFLMGYIKKHDFKVFGWYRIALGAVVLLYFGLMAK